MGKVILHSIRAIKKGNNWEITVCVEIEGYCSITPRTEHGALWPSKISVRIGQVLSATCAVGYIESQDGVPHVTCSAGGSSAGTGEWSSAKGNCTGITLSHFSRLARIPIPRSNNRVKSIHADLLGYRDIKNQSDCICTDQQNFQFCRGLGAVPGYIRCPGSDCRFWMVMKNKILHQKPDHIEI